MLRSLLRSEPPTERSVDLSAYAAMWRDSLLPYSPVPVTVQTALTQAACSACIDALATSVASLPVDVIRGSVPVVPEPSLIRSPSGLVAVDVWRYQLMDSVLTDGNAFGEITTYTGTYPSTIELYDPATVTDRRIEGGKPAVTINNERRLLYPFGDVWHMPGRFVRAGSPFAESPVTRARSTIGSAIAARDFGGKFFGDGAHPGGIITSAEELTAEQAAAIKAAFLNAVKGSREPAVLGAGLEYTPVMINPNDSQFIELMRFVNEEACRFWRVPPAMIYAASSGQNITYANVSQADLAYLKHSLEGHLVRFENAMTALLPRPQFVRVNRNAFLRSDPAGRSEVVDRRLKNKTLTVNEARMLEDERPFSDPEFDKPGIPGGGPSTQQQGNP